MLHQLVSEPKLLFINGKKQPYGRYERSAFVCKEIVCKEQPMICLRHIKERFGGVAVQKREHERTQHGVLIDHLANMDGLNVYCRQPKPQYTGAEDKFISKQ
jgi:hypothetical protein